MAHDPQIHLAAGIDKSYIEIPKTIKTDALRRVALAFVVNIDRVVALIEFAPLALGYAQHLQALLARSRDTASAALQSSSGTIHPLPSAALQPARPTDGEKYVQERSFNLAAGYEELAVWARLHPDIPLGIEAALAVEIVGVWTAFEVLATDLWTKALNVNPKLAYYASMTAAKSSKGDEDAIDNDLGKQISVEMIDRHGYHLHDKMGTLLKASKKFNFNRLSGIRGAYESAFGKEASKVFDSPKYARLTALEGLRNVLVHSAVKVDADFKMRAEASAKAYGALADLPIGADVPVDGPMALEFANLSVNACVSLLHLVDDMLAGRINRNVGGALTTR